MSRRKILRRARSATGGIELRVEAAGLGTNSRLAGGFPGSQFHKYDHIRNPSLRQSVGGKLISQCLNPASGLGGQVLVVSANKQKLVA